MAIMEGLVLRPLTALAKGANRTWFVAQSDPQLARKRWINAMKTKGELRLMRGQLWRCVPAKACFRRGLSR